MELTLVFTFILGLIVGSFLNVVVYRLNTGRTVAGRSLCLACGQQLAWYDLVPLFSFLFLGGRCRYCRAKISWQYPLVELATAALFAAVASKFPAGPAGVNWWWLLWWLVMSLIVVIVVYDWRHQIIPDGPVYLLIALALIYALVQPDRWWYLATGAGWAGFFALLWAGSRGRWLGLGDAKLALALGFLLGWPGALGAMVWSFWSGAGVGLALLAVGRYSTIKAEVPFAPFLALGFALNFFFNLNVFFF